ncbi:MAG: response regulator [Anaerolineae bacterium]|nr:response regulator [Anaerolineae bacterium]
MNKSVILIVDDEERVLFVLQNALTKLSDGFKVLTANTAHDALRKASQEHCDLVMTDLIMPDTGGIEFTEKIRAMEGEPTVVWMTAYGCQSFKAEAERLGVYRCVEKPLEIDEVRKLARDALGERLSG